MLEFFANLCKFSEILEQCYVKWWLDYRKYGSVSYSFSCIFKCQRFWGDSLQLIFSLTLITLGAFLLLVSRTPTVIVSHKWSLDRTFFPRRLFLSVNHPGSGGRPMVITLRGLFRAKASCGMVKRTADATGWSKLIGIETFGTKLAEVIRLRPVHSWWTGYTLFVYGASLFPASFTLPT